MIDTETKADVLLAPPPASGSSHQEGVQAPWVGRYRPAIGLEGKVCRAQRSVDLCRSPATSRPAWLGPPKALARQEPHDAAGQAERGAIDARPHNECLLCAAYLSFDV